MMKFLFTFLLSIPLLAQKPFYAQFRYFHLETDNEKVLPDFTANALGAEVGYSKSFLKNWKIDLSGSISTSFLNSSNLATSRYEIGLFDQATTGNQDFLARIEKASLSYQNNKLKIKLGRQVLNTPFINPQDGRMRPSAEGGIFAEYKDFTLGYLYEMAPRGTMGWSSVAESIGYYPGGVSYDGKKSTYAGHVTSAGIFMAGMDHKWKGISLKFHDLFVENLLQSALISAEFAQPIQGGKWNSGLQFIKQHSLSDNLYAEKNTHASVISLKTGLEYKRWNASINFTNISAEGRYLMPREWGKDPFYTFMPRERNEGLGGVNAYVAKFSYAIPGWKMKINPSVGYFDLPSITNFGLNKYGMPSYSQTNIELLIDASKIAKGLDFQLLFANKTNQGDTMENTKYIQNKVNMNSWNFVVNYRL
ncbi:MAG: hypothetical protein RL045_110 [Bacteroidota bacterium]